MATGIEAQERAITQEEADFYDEHGWVFLPGLLPEQVATDLLQRAQALQAKQDARERELVKERDKQHKGYTDMNHAVILSMPSQQDDVVRSLVMSKKAGANAQKLIGRSVGVRAWANFFLYKAPFRQSEEGADETIWHQDDPASPRDRSGHMVMWMSLVHATPEMGTMRFISGSHREGSFGNVAIRTPDGDFEGNHLIERHPRLARHQLSPPFTYRPGDATVHSGLTLHSAPRNVTNRPRWAFLRAYIPADTLNTGAGVLASNGRTPSEMGIEPNRPFEGPDFPVIYP